MKKVDAAVWKETRYIALWVLILSALLQAVFLVIGQWDYTVLLGNLLTGAASVLNFLLMGISVQNALEKDEKSARSVMRVSQLYRNLFMVVVVALGVALPCFHVWAAVIPVFFPRISIAFRPLFDRAENGGE